MKVKELIEELKKLENQDAEVICTTEDEDILPAGQEFRVFEVDGVILKKALRGLDENDQPSIEFTDEEGSKEYAFIDIISDPDAAL